MPASYEYGEGLKNKESVATGYWSDKASRGGVPLHEAIFSTVRYIQKHQSYKIELMKTCIRLFGNYRIDGIGPGEYSVTNPETKKSLRINVCKSVPETLKNKIGKERPRPRVVTEGGHYMIQRMGKLMSKYVLGVFLENSVYKYSPMVFLDAAIVRHGAMAVIQDPDQGRIIIERVLPGEVVFDDAEAHAGLPYSIFRIKAIPRSVAMARWPKYKEKIKECPSPKNTKQSGKSVSDLVEVAEAWRRPSGPGKKDGVHSIAFETCTVLEETWDRGFPIVFFKYAPGVFGMSGESLVEELIGIQVAINETLMSIGRTLKLWGKPFVFLPDEANLAKGKLSNELGEYYTLSNMEHQPFVKIFAELPPELRPWLSFLLDQAYAIPGISQLSARSEKPSGLNAAVALREQQDIESERYATVEQAYDDFFVELAKVVINESADLFEKNKDLQSTVIGHHFIEKIKWGEIKIDKNQYELQIHPTSMLPKTPAGRTAQVQEWIDAGWVSKEEGMKLLDMPDLEDANTLYNAAIDDIDSVIDQFLYTEPEKDEEIEDLFESPDPMSNLTLGIKRMQAAYLRGKNDGVPVERLSLMLDWINEAKMLIQQSQQQEAPPDQAAMMEQGAMPPEGIPPEGMPTGGGMPQAPIQ